MSKLLEAPPAAHEASSHWLESSHELQLADLLAEIAAQNLLDLPILQVAERTPNSIKHQLSHQQLLIKFWEIKLDGTLENGLDFAQIKAHPFPIVLYNFIANDMQA